MYKIPVHHLRYIFLKKRFAEKAQNVRTTPMCNELINRARYCTTSSISSQAHSILFRLSRSVGTADMSPFEQRLKEMTKTNVENLLLHRELDDMKAALESRTEWFEAKIDS